jgi:hypothetical protein
VFLAETDANIGSVGTAGWHKKAAPNRSGFLVFWKGINP